MKKKPNIFLRMIIVLFLIFIFLYAMVKSGYYESKIAKKTLLTEQKIKEFEHDVKIGKEINIDNYYNEEEKDYSSIASKAGKQLTLKLSKSLNTFFSTSGKVIKKLFW